MQRTKILDFPANYRLLDGDVDDLPRLAPLSPDGLAVGISADGREFVLVLPDGGGEYGAGVFLASTPDPDTLLVGAFGEAYLVTLTDPIQVKGLTCFAASACAAFPKKGALVVVDFLGLTCIGAQGVAWTSSHLSDDVIRFVGQDDDNIILNTYSAPDAAWSTNRFPISLETPL